MRQDIKMLCVTNWGEVLELRTEPVGWCTSALNGYDEEIQFFMQNVTVADPNAIDAGVLISLDEIKLVARKKL